MNRLTKHLIVISFDGLATLDFQYIKELPNFKEYLSEAAFCKKVYSIYPSLTYPAHTSIITGRYPKSHGIVNNTLLQPERTTADWYWQRKYIKGETVYDIAIERGMKVAALLWPVTGRSKIQFNMPEIFANRPWHNQVVVSLMNGSPIYQLSLNKRFGHLRKGLKQPYLDNFVHEAMLYTIKKKKPDLTLVHYVDLDSMRHYYGFNSKEAEEALQRHDRRLGEIIRELKRENMYEDSTIVVLGDHSSLDESKMIKLNVLLREKGYIKVDGEGNIVNYKAIVKSCDGSAYVYIKDKEDTALRNSVYELINTLNKEHNCIEKIYTSNEAADLGADPRCSYMLEGNLGYYFSDELNGEVLEKVNFEEVGKRPHLTKATHGYSPLKKDYTTVFMATGKGIAKGVEVDEMKLVDETPILARLLGLELKNTEGEFVGKFFE